MSEFKKGDRVKATVEGMVVWASPTGTVEVGSSAVIWPGDGVTIEKLSDPLPTTPGSVIRNRNYGSLYMRVDGGWLGEDGEVTPWTLTPTIYEPIFDAGAVK